MAENGQSQDRADEEERARRREEARLLRAAAASTTPDAYKVRRPKAEGPIVDDGPEDYTNLFGVFTRGKSTREIIAMVLLVGSNGFAYILLIIAMNLAQCSWWYVPGMYSGHHQVESSGR